MNVFWILKHLGLEESLCLGLGRIYSLDHYYVLNLNLKHYNLVERTRLAYSLQSVDEVLFWEIVDRMNMLNPGDRRELIARFHFYKSGFKNCYAAILINGEVAYLQWIIYPHENSIIDSAFHNQFRQLKQREIMLENAFTFPRYRGLGLMASVTSDLLYLAKNQQYKSAVTYIGKNRIDSLNVFVRMGFRIRKIIREYKILFYTKRML